MTDTRTPKDNLREIVAAAHPLDPVQQAKRDELLNDVHRLDVNGSRLARAGKMVRYQDLTSRLVGWGEQNYINHWWIQQRFAGMIKSACGINSTRSWVQWVEHYPNLIRCEVCQGFEIQHLSNRARLIKTK